MSPSFLSRLNWLRRTASFLRPSGEQRLGSRLSWWERQNKLIEIGRASDAKTVEMSGFETLSAKALCRLFRAYSLAGLREGFDYGTECKSTLWANRTEVGSKTLRNETGELCEQAQTQHHRGWLRPHGCVRRSIAG